jgi:hypothetical protein
MLTDCRRSRSAVLDRADLGADRDHRVGEAVDACSLSIGSTISVPGTGKLIVGAWKP